MGMKKIEFSKEGRICTRCKEFKPWELFYKRKQGVNGKECQCIPCKSEMHRMDRFHLKTTGWTGELWDLCFELQEGICAIDGCSNKAHSGDHCHVTGEPRALLCRKCNSALGFMNEDTHKIAGLLRYAEQCENVRSSWKQD